MTRAILYARFSTENQSTASVVDQLRLCRAYAEQIGATVIREFWDEEISGTIDARPGFTDLMAFARSGGCDLVIAEHTDRLHRGGSGGWTVFETLQDLGVAYRTVMEDEVTAIKQSVSTLISTHKIEEVKVRTRRGLRGVVEAGRSAGGLSYGYRRKRLYDEAGEPIRGHLEIDEAQAEVVRRIFRDYAAGSSPLAIAQALNDEGEPGPRGGPWYFTTIGGNARDGNGVIHNELYVGMRVWGRRTFVKNRHTGARRGRAAPTAPIRKAAPELRILSDELWDSVQARHAEMSRPHTAEGRARSAKRPKRFLQGLITCGMCGGSMVRAGPKQALRCNTRARNKGCENTKTPGYPAIEARVITAIRENLLHPDVIEHAIRIMKQELEKGRQASAKRDAKLRTELTETRRRMDRLIDQLEEGTPWKAIEPRHTALEARTVELAAEIAKLAAEAGEPERSVIELPSASAAKYRRHIDGLVAALDNPEDLEGREDRGHVRALIHQIRFIPAEGFNAYELEIVGDLAPLLALGTNEKAPLAGGSSSAKVMPKVGAGTRTVYRHHLAAPVRLSA